MEPVVTSRELHPDYIYRWVCEYEFHGVRFTGHLCNDCPLRFNKRLERYGMPLVHYDMGRLSRKAAYFCLLQVHKDGPHTKCDECGTTDDNYRPDEDEGVVYSDFNTK